MPTRVKICCISSTDEAALAVKYGASAVGLVSEMPSGPGVISERQIIDIVATVPPPVATFLLTSKQNPTEIASQQQKCRTNTLQLVERLSTDSHESLRKLLPGIGLVQVIHVTGKESVAEAQSVAKGVDAILLDTGNRNSPVKVLGGTGRTHDWSVSKEIVDSVEVPVILAGGLNQSNVREAINQVRPFAVDVCSGVRTDGKLDETKLAKIMNEVAESSTQAV